MLCDHQLEGGSRIRAPTALQGNAESALFGVPRHVAFVDGVLGVDVVDAVPPDPVNVAAGGIADQLRGRPHHLHIDAIGVSKARSRKALRTAVISSGCRWAPLVSTTMKARPAAV